MSNIVISALIRRRREIACDLARLQSDIAAIDRVLYLFDPTLKPGQIKALAFYKREGWAARGEISRSVVDSLRKATAPLASAQIVEIMGDGGDRAKQMKRIWKALGRLERRGLVRSVRDTGRVMWEIAR